MKQHLFQIRVSKSIDQRWTYSQSPAEPFHANVLYSTTNLGFAKTNRLLALQSSTDKVAMSSPKRLEVLPRGPPALSLEAVAGAASKTQNIQLGELDMLSEDRDSSSDLEEFSEAISDYTSSSGDSELESSGNGETRADSEDEEQSEDGETPIDTVAARKRIKMSPTPTNLRLRLSKFLPQLQQANIHLEEAGNALVSRL